MRFATLMPVSKLPSWSLAIKESSSNSKWMEVLSRYQEMRRSGAQITDHSVFPCILKTCTNLSLFKHGISVHGCLLKRGFDLFTSVRNSIMDFYLKNGVLNSALVLFDEMTNRDSVSWNTIIHGRFSQGFAEEGLWWFHHARIAGFEPNVSTLVIVVQSCRNLGDVREGNKLHRYIIQTGFSGSLSVHNSLLSMYADTDMMIALRLFDEMVESDVISWSAMIVGYVRNNQVEDAFLMFREMVFEVGIQPDGITIVSILKACTDFANIKMGTSIHTLVICKGFNPDVFVMNALIDMYSKYFYISTANKVFNETLYKNSVTWNSLLSGFVQNGKNLEAVSLFSLMTVTGIEADEVTLVNLLQICKLFTDSLQSKSVHAKVIRLGYEMNELVMNSLMDAYAKCGLIELSWKLFSGMTRKDVISWSTMIAAFTHCGKPDEAVAVFNEMNGENENPNTITILNLLEACTVSAELRRSKWAHAIAIRRGLHSEVAFGTAILDMYSKCGQIEAARKAFDQILAKNIVAWSAMIGGYGMNGLAHNALALLAEMKLQGLKPNEVTFLSVISACSHGGLVEEGLFVFKQMVQDHNIEPKLEHYSCIVDLLSRAGRLNLAMDLINKMPEDLKSDGSVWGALLNACRLCNNSELGTEAVSHALELEPLNSANYMLASNMYAASGLWKDAAKMRYLANERRVRVVAGYSLVHVENNSHKFIAGAQFQSCAKDIRATVKQLHNCMEVDEKDFAAMVA